MSKNEQKKVVIVGGGHGGGNLVAALRQAGHCGPIALIGDEPMVPYHRPPLSKAYLKGTSAAETLKLRPDSWYAENGVELYLGQSAVRIDTDSRHVHLEDGSKVPYEILVLATGSRARRLTIPGCDLNGVYHLRDLRDADMIRASIGPGRKLAIVGGGYIGLEVAASAIALGAEAVILERERRILARVACQPLAAFLARYHRSKGVEIVTNAEVETFEGIGEQVSAIRLATGQVVECDAILVGVGAQICDQLARDVGLDCETGGVVVDDNGRTSAEGIYAIGDMTWRPMPLYNGRMFRLESVPNAVEQGRRVAAHIVGKPAPAHEVPWFWSDQYDLKLQIVGVPFDSRRLVVRGSIDDAKFAIYHLSDEGRVLAVEAVNMMQEFITGRTLVGEGRIVASDRLLDTSVPIKQLLQA